MKLCKICNKRKATIKYSESHLNYVHGYFTMLCKKCYIEMLEDKIKDIKKEIKELKMEEKK